MLRDEWKVVKGCVEKWCEPRKSQLVKDGTGASDSEIDTLIDQWNNVYATKFCSENKKLLEAAGWRKGAEECSTNSSAATPHNSRVSQGSAPQNEPLVKELDFEGVIWPTIKDELMKFAESKILSWVEDKLQERVQALDSLTRPPLLKANSFPESYQIYVRYLKNRIKAAGKNSTAIRDTEAVMSMALDLLPGLEERLRDQLEHVVDKKEDRPGAGIKYDHDEANDESENSHKNSEEADHDIDHKVQEAQEDNHDGDELEARLEHNSEEDEDGDEDVDDFDDFEEFYADESEDDTYEDPDEPGRQYRGSVIDSIEPRTPIVTPRVMRQLRSYEQRYWDTIVVAKVETEVAAAVLRSVDKEEHEVASRKRKAPDSAEPALAIRSKSMEQRLAAVGTPTPTGRKRQKFSEASYSPASTTCSSELPSLEEIFSSSIGRASSATTQPPTNSSSPAVRVNKKKRGGKDRSRAQSRVSLELRDPTTGTATATAPSPGGMIGASPELGTRGASKDFVFEKSVSRHPILEERFREETAEFQAMTPSAREAMLYTALREMRRRQG